MAGRDKQVAELRTLLAAIDALFRKCAVLSAHIDATLAGQQRFIIIRPAPRARRLRAVRAKRRERAG
jgi:hypothetical protein